MKIDLEKIGPVCNITKKVIQNFNLMDENQFMRSYQCSKLRYYKRVMKYGDPYMNAPLAKLAKFFSKNKRK